MCRLVLNLFASRLSALLSSGALVAWFQGRRDFGRRSFGSRSILCDPSAPYARDNVNVYLRRQNVHDPLPLVMAASTAAAMAPQGSLWGYFGECGASPWRAKMSAAIDRQGRCLGHVASAAAMPELAQLLELHRARTGVLPATWTDMIRAGFLRGVPADPAGTPLRLDASTGRVSLDPKSSLNPLPTSEHPL